MAVKFKSERQARAAAILETDEGMKAWKQRMAEKRKGIQPPTRAELDAMMEKMRAMEQKLAEQEAELLKARKNK